MEKPKHKMAKEEVIRMSGQIVECLPNATFRVVINNTHNIFAYIGGKIRKNDIKILLGDTVEVELSPYDLTRGRIVYRTR